MKGLRRYIHAVGPYHYWVFLPCDLNEGITTNICTGNNTRWRKVFTLWPEWRDYDEYNESHIKSLSDLVFTLWPEWRDYDLIIGFLGYWLCLCFYLVTWMKGLRHTLLFAMQYAISSVFTLWPEWRDYDSPGTWRSTVNTKSCFYLVTWMKGLRLNLCRKECKHLICVFTLWPEWRDYDAKYLCCSLLCNWFLPCDLNEGITT